jgi:hypothetical protein
MRKSTVILENDAAGHLALLTLRKGVCAWGTWAFDAADAGKTLTIGATRRCDWQIASPGVDPLSLAFTGDSVLVRVPRHDPRVRRNGSPLPLGWVELEHGDVLDIGPSSLAVCLAPRLRRKQRARAQRARNRKARRAQDARWVERVEPAEAGTSLALHAQAREADAAPALFPPSERDAARPLYWFWYAAIVLVTLTAYAGWLAVLDRM